MIDLSTSGAPVIAAEYPLVLTLYKPFSRDYRGDRNLRVFDNRLPFVSNLNVIRADESLDNIIISLTIYRFWIDPCA